MKIRIISNIGPREVPLKGGDSIADVMAAKELSGFQVILPVCKDRQLKEPLSEKVSLQKQGLEDNSTIYCKFDLKVKEKEEKSNMGGPVSSDIKSSAVAKTDKRSSKTAGKRTPPISTNNLDVLSPMHVKPTMVIRKRSSIPSVDKLLFSPPPPNKGDKLEATKASVPKLSMRMGMDMDGFDGIMNNTSAKTESALSPLRMKPMPMLRKRSQSQSSEVDDSLFSPTGKIGSSKKARLEPLPTPPSV
ncbi:unnamed protein product [Cylindrotheca closterium]|uniref:Uncharacterized protein n=1 Tax=Cylindrotheca closterium TaxID=2856 RepID=A0AAD2G0U4_9STRA|nr:unnamed protein product [Cylindrotheca closterium]